MNIYVVNWVIKQHIANCFLTCCYTRNIKYYFTKKSVQNYNYCPESVKCTRINSYNCTRNRINNWKFLQLIKEQYYHCNVYSIKLYINGLSSCR